MNKLEKYDIPFVGLKLGLHIFSYNVNSDLLSEIEESPINECDVEVQLEFLKRENVFELGFNFSGNITTECDRCNDVLLLPIEDRFKILVKFKPLRAFQNLNDDPDIMYIDRNETHLNVAELIYEFLILSMPMYKVHTTNEDGTSNCNPAIMEWLQTDNELLEDEASDDLPLENEEEINDPRWEALRKLKEKK